jgi:hypothetical protein
LSGAVRAVAGCGHSPTHNVGTVAGAVAAMSPDVADKTFEVATETGDVAALTFDVERKTFTVANKTFDVGTKTFDVADKTFDVADKTFEIFGQKFIGKRLNFSHLHEKSPRPGKICRFCLPIHSGLPQAADKVGRHRSRSV